MPIKPAIPRDIRLLPFRGSEVVRAGGLTWRALRGSAWRRLLPDVYIRADVAMDHRLWCHAASVYAGGRGAVSGRSAAWIWGVGLLPQAEGPVDLTVPARVRLAASPHLRVTRAALEPGDVTTYGGVQVTVPERTAFDIGRQPPLVDGLIGVDALLHARLVTLPVLVDYALGRPGWRGIEQFRRVLNLAEPGAESPMETRLRLVLIEGGLPRPVAQHPVTKPGGGLVGRLDLAYPEYRLGIEYDGDHHRAPDTFRRDIGRLNALAAVGWTVLRFSAVSVFRYPDEIVRRVRELLP